MKPTKFTDEQITAMCASHLLCEIAKLEGWTKIKPMNRPDDNEDPGTWFGYQEEMDEGYGGSWEIPIYTGNVDDALRLLDRSPSLLYVTIGRNPANKEWCVCLAEPVFNGGDVHPSHKSVAMAICQAVLMFYARGWDKQGATK